MPLYSPSFKEGYSLLQRMIFSFHNLPQPYHVTASHSSPGNKPPECERAFWKNMGTKQKLQRENQLLHMHQGSPLLPIIYYRSVSTVISLLSKEMFTPSIQPYLGLPSTRPPLTSAINTFLAIRYSSIFSTCPNHPNNLWSTISASSLSIPALLCTSSFRTIKSWGSHQTSQTLHLQKVHFLLSVLSIIPRASAP